MLMQAKCCTDIIFLSLIIFNLIKTNHGACDVDTEWECDNGSCISDDDRCDGKKDCSDGSDETSVTCVLYECPHYAFRCAYGGCVSGLRKCNGQIDCADGSDETIPLCGNETEKENYYTKLEGTCGDFQMQCSITGECIDDDYKCDGILHCADGSDETVELCSRWECPKYAFQCGYGACVGGKASCNSVNDCSDGSDESYELCGYKRVFGQTIPVTTTTKKPTIKTTVPTTTTVSSLIPNVCDIPFRPHLILKNGNGQRVESPIKINDIVNYACEKGYSLLPQDRKVGFCNGNEMNAEVPHCVKYCDANEITSDFSTVAFCKYEDETYMCNKLNRMRPGTEASYQCATYFYPHRNLPVRTCTERGNWNQNRYGCKMHCGTTVHSKPLSKNAVDVNNTNIPWHVGIYVNTNEVTFNYTCGATIISPIVVLTAAHCAYDALTKSAILAENFRVIAGKYYREYYRKEDEVQEMLIEKILINEKYGHISSVYTNDLAIFVLKKHFKFSQTVRPICLNFKEFSEREIQSDIDGQMGAWGHTDDVRTAEVLQVVPGTQFNYYDCRSQTDTEALTSEKFCVKPTVGTACRGDSGGGYYTYDEREKTYYLTGVLSNANVATDGCAIGYLLMTNIQHYGEWIQAHTTYEENNYIKD